MKKYILFAFIIVISIIASGCQKKEVIHNDIEEIINRGYLIAGVKEDSPPFGYHDENGKLQGIDIEIAKKIANDIFETNSDNIVHFIEVTPQNRIAKLNSKEIDILVATMSINSKRKLVIDFSLPYFTASQKLMVKRSSKISNIHYFNTSGKLGVVLGTTGEKIIHLAAPTARIIGTKTYSEAVGLLKAGEIDAIIGDDCILQGYLSDELKIINKSYSKEQYAVAVRKSEKSKELLNKINTTIASLLDEGILNNVKNKYIKKGY